MTTPRWMAAALMLAGACQAALAQSWPSKQIEMIIAFPAGSGVDVIGRAVGAAISQQAGQSVVVLNRDGAAGTLGFGALAGAAPDGHTIAFGPTTPIANAPYLVKGVRYNVESFSYICQVFENVFAVAVGPQSKIKSVQELLAAAKDNPGKLTYGHAGIGTIPHLSTENMGDALNHANSPRCRSAAMRRWCRRCCAARSISPPSACRPFVRSPRSARSRSSPTSAMRPIRTSPR